MKKRAASSNGSRARRASGTAATKRMRGSRPRTPSLARRATPARGRSRRSARLTTDHEEIRRWAEARGGQPATVKSTVRSGQPGGVLRIDFPGYSGAKSLKQISWEEWFEIFEQRRLGLLKQDRTVGGKPSRFNKLVCRD